jgi:hypothetical protein
MCGPGRIRTSEAEATGLQPVPFVHSGTDPGAGEHTVGAMSERSERIDDTAGFSLRSSERGISSPPKAAA